MSMQHQRRDISFWIGLFVRRCYVEVRGFNLSCSFDLGIPAHACHSLLCVLVSPAVWLLVLWAIRGLPGFGRHPIPFSRFLHGSVSSFSSSSVLLFRYSSWSLLCVFAKVRGVCLVLRGGGSFDTVALLLLCTPPKFL